MAYFPRPVARLVEQLQRLPGIGPKTAQRLAFHLIRAPEEEARALSTALIEAKEKTILCSVCCNVTESDPCAICRDPRRDPGLLCVVEEPRDFVALERTREYKGRYHVLHGAISPMDGIGPDELKMRELLGRLQEGRVQEVIMATDPDVEGDATAMYVARLVKPLDIRVTRISRGLPVGGDLEYADEVTLARALEGRREF